MMEETFTKQFEISIHITECNNKKPSFESFTYVLTKDDKILQMYTDDYTREAVYQNDYSQLPRELVEDIDFQFTCSARVGRGSRMDFFNLDDWFLPEEIMPSLAQFLREKLNDR